MINEALIYFQIGVWNYPDILENCRSVKPTPREACQLVAEEAYIYQNKAVADWFEIIESFEHIPENDRYVFVHRAKPKD